MDVVAAVSDGGASVRPRVSSGSAASWFAAAPRWRARNARRPGKDGRGSGGICCLYSRGSRSHSPRNDTSPSGSSLDSVIPWSGSSLPFLPFAQPSMSKSGASANSSKIEGWPPRWRWGFSSPALKIPPRIVLSFSNSSIRCSRSSKLTGGPTPSAPRSGALAATLVGPKTFGLPPMSLGACRCFGEDGSAGD